MTKQIARLSRYPHTQRQYYADQTSLIALSGLGGHAFGSFKEKGGSHMWLRDSLPKDLSGMRILIYGYDTQLENSSSTQNIRDLGKKFRSAVNNIRNYGNVSSFEAWVYVSSHHFIGNKPGEASGTSWALAWWNCDQTGLRAYLAFHGQSKLMSF